MFPSLRTLSSSRVNGPLRNSAGLGPDAARERACSPEPGRYGCFPCIMRGRPASPGQANVRVMTVSNYLDEEIAAIMKATSELTGTSEDTLYEDFAAFTVPSLMSTYEPLIDPKWSLADLLLNLEDGVYRMIRTRSPGAQPPRMQFERIGPGQLRFHYDSPRRMPALAKGFVKGIAAYYGVTVDIQEQENPDGSVDFTITML